jgi:hypothetical protein
LSQSGRARADWVQRDDIPSDDCILRLFVFTISHILGMRT